MAILYCTAGCAQTAPAPEPHDELVDLLRKHGATDRCIKQYQNGGLQAMSRATDQCFKMTGMQRWSGVWRHGFEDSRFCPAPERACGYQAPGPTIWLQWGKDAKLPPGSSGGALYAIEFVGRRTLMPGFHGHMGVSDHAIIVDRVISIRPVTGPDPR